MEVSMRKENSGDFSCIFFYLSAGDCSNSFGSHWTRFLTLLRVSRERAFTVEIAAQKAHDHTCYIRRNIIALIVV